MMKRVSQLMLVAIMLLVSFPFVGDVFAETQTQDLEVNIQSGGMSLKVPNTVSISDITLKKEVDSFKIGFDGNVVINDLRGSQAGWRLNLSATPLTEVETGHQLPIGSLLTAPTAKINSTTIGYDANLPTVLNAYPYQIDGDPVPFSRAEPNTGMGSFEISFDPGEALLLSISAATAKEGTYQSTITWDLVSAP